jgi:translation initiation factor IF-3
MKSKNKSSSQQTSYRTNNQIQTDEVRLVSGEGENLGVIPLEEAKNKAQDAGLDLVEIAPQAEPPVCKMLNYGKFLYTQAKQQRLKNAKQKKNEVKSIRLSYRIEQHDMEMKVNQIKKFLEQGHKVKLDMVLRGREKAFSQVAREKLEEILTMLPEEISREQDIQKTPQGLSATVAKK